MPFRAVAPVGAEHLGGGQRHRVEVVVPELTGGVAAFGVVAEVGAVAVPLAGRGTVGDDRLLALDPDAGAQHCRAVVLALAQGLAEGTGGHGVLERLVPQHVWSHAPEGQGADAGQAGVGVELVGPLQHGRVGLAPLAGVVGHELDRVLGEAEGLVGVGGEGHILGFAGHRASPWIVGQQG
ncbi:MAG: hypothetical protein HND58_14105 [Planctomycetota bacterium]|nr:MAG: hypothetical protein HND58_14105 [Planctomycetota bacterium]